MARRSPRKSGKRSKRRSPRKSGRKSKRRSPRKSGKKSKRRSPKKSGKKSKRSSRPTYEKAQKEEQKGQEKEARKEARREEQKQKEARRERKQQERRQQEQTSEEFGIPYYPSQEEQAQQQEQQRAENERDRIDEEIAFKRNNMSVWDVINMINDVAGIDPLHVTIESSPADVKKAYRRATLKTHPDKANQMDDLEVYKFEQTFILLKDKYDDYLARFAPAGYLRRRKRYSRRR